MTKPQNPTPTSPVCMWNVKEVGTCLGHKNAKTYADVRAELLTAPVRRGRKLSRWPSNEVESILRARIAGADDAAVRALVGRLMAQRTKGSHA